MLKRKKGQSILEYVVVLVAIVAVIAWAAKEIIGKAVGKGLDDARTTVGNAADNLAK
ncbi:MAG: hypothetical protein PHE18_01565 [Candidatus Omnitrophica bacterium]|nr:hypothetical protein [Candidatus Omnitrophota bacterium]MDD5552542.1 hypothetical protein [Candidatus Omnitrophota bacterium]